MEGDRVVKYDSCIAGIQRNPRNLGTSALQQRDGNNDTEMASFPALRWDIHSIPPHLPCVNVLSFCATVPIDRGPRNPGKLGFRKCFRLDDRERVLSFEDPALRGWIQNPAWRRLSTRMIGKAARTPPKRIGSTVYACLVSGHYGETSS